jgi:excisionase family DNA binding protein
MSTNIISLAPRLTGQPVPASARSTSSIVAMSGRAVYTVAEVAVMLSLSTGSTYALVRAGEIPAKKMGARWVIPKRRFHAWLDGLPEASDEDIA